MLKWLFPIKVDKQHFIIHICKDVGHLFKQLVGDYPKLPATLATDPLCNLQTSSEKEEAKINCN